MGLDSLSDIRARGGLNTLASPVRGGTGWAKSIRDWLQPDPNSMYGNILPVASSTQYSNPTTLDAQGRAIHGAEQAYTSRRPAMPNMVRETLGNLVNYADAPRAAAMGEMDPTTPENVEMIVRGAFDAGAGGMLFNKMPRGAIGAFGRAAKDLTPSEQQAQSVIDLLRGGKASSVTDDMLAAADQKYLYDNYDLPMDVESRMARAKDMGFGETPVYHGTGEDFAKFDPDKSIGSQYWSTTDRAAVEAGDVGAGRSGVTMQLKEAINNPAGWDEYDKFGVDEMIGRGHSGMRLPEADGSATFVAFDPQQYRSQFARFDPRLSGLSNLSASGMSPAFAAFGGLSPVSQIQEYLDGIRKKPKGGGK